MIENKYIRELNSFIEIYSQYKVERTAFNVLQRTSGVLLFREYLRRLMIWKKVLNDENFRITNIDTHNLFLNFKDLPWSENFMLKDDFLNTFEQKGYKCKRRYFDSSFVYWYISWNIFNDHDEIKKYNLPNPYEPAALIFQRGQYVSQSEGQITIDHLFFNNLKKNAHFTLPSLQHKFLDFVDETTYGGELNHTGIPNQKETNKLWEEFQKTGYNG